MLFYLILVLIISLIMLPCYSIQADKKYKTTAITIITIILILILGLRNFSVGMGDTYNLYIPEFNRIQNLSLLEISLNYKDPIFYLLTRILSICVKSPQLWIFICGCLYIIPVMKTIYKYSKYHLLSIILFLALNFYGTAFSGIRHCIACGILCFAYKALNEKKQKNFIISVIIASCFHISSIIFLLSYPIYNSKKLCSNKGLVTLGILIFILFIINNLYGQIIITSFINFLIQSFNLSRFSIYAATDFSSLNNNLFFINYGIYIVSYLLSKNSQDTSLKSEIALQGIGTALLAFTTSLGEFYRLSYFFIQYSIILFPNIISTFKVVNTRKIFRILVYIFGIVYFLLFSASNTKIIPYIPFWK